MGLSRPAGNLRPRLAWAVLLVAVPIAAATHVESDRSVDLGQYRTFGMYEGEPDLAVSDPLIHTILLQTLREHLARMGMTEVEDSPDCWFTYRAIEERHGVAIAGRLARIGDDSFSEDDGEIRVASGWVGTVAEYSTGTLLVDVFDASGQRLIWRGTVTDVANPGPAQRQRQLEKAARRLIRKWERDYRRHGR